MRARWPLALAGCLLATAADGCGESSAETTSTVEGQLVTDTRDACRVFPAPQVAEEYGLLRSAPLESIAAAFAANYDYEVRDEIEQACLEGLRLHRERADKR